MCSPLNELRACRAFLLDLDGTLYLGDDVIPGAVEFIRGLRDTGREFVYLTNNSSRYSQDYVNRLRGMGFPCEPENVLSAGLATAMYLAEEHPGAGVFPVGTADFSRELSSRGVRLDYDAPDIVCVAMDWELSYEKLTRAINFVRRGAVYLAANPDLVCPEPGGDVIPDTAAVCAIINAASGREPTYIGKPERRMVDIISKRTGIPNELICCVGDRLYTDIEVGINAGAKSALVLTGETTREMLAASPIKPDWVFDSVRELGRAAGLAVGAPTEVGKMGLY